MGWLVLLIFLGVLNVALPIVATRRAPPFSARAYLLTVLVVLAIEIVWLGVALLLEPGEPISMSALAFTAILAALEAILLIAVLLWSAAGLLKVDSISPATIIAGLATFAVAAVLAILAFTTEVFGPNRGVPLGISLMLALPWAGLFIQGRRARPGYLRFVGIVQLIACEIVVLVHALMLVLAYGMLAAHSR